MFYEDVAILSHIVADNLDHLASTSDGNSVQLTRLAEQLRAITSESSPRDILRCYEVVSRAEVFLPDARFFLMQKVIHDCFVLDPFADDYADEDEETANHETEREHQ